MENRGWDSFITIYNKFKPIDMFVANLALSDDELQALLRIAKKRGFKGVNLMISSDVKQMIKREDPGEDKNQMTIQAHG